MADPTSADDYDPYAEDDPETYDPYANEDVEAPEEIETSPFPEKPGTSAASIQLPEIASPGMGTRAFLPPSDSFAQGAKNLGVTAAMLTTSDPAEIAKMLKANNPDVGITYAPDGTLIATNNKNGAQAVINRPGISYMDILQLLGLGAAFFPSGKIAALATEAPLLAARTAITATARNKALKTATGEAAGRMALGAGTTEGALQSGQALAGGEFNAGDVALSTAMGGGQEYIARPAVSGATKIIPGSLQEAKEAIPEVLGGKTRLSSAIEASPTAVGQALTYADATARKIATTDALHEKLTKPLKIFAQMAERIPLTGLGHMRVVQQQQRVEALTELAHRYNIDVDTPLGQEIAQSFIDRMVRARFWGVNRNPTPDALARAWVRESNTVTDRVLRRHLAAGDLNGDVVDKLLNKGTPVLQRELFAKLNADGQRAVRQRFMTRALTAAKWRPDAAPQEVDPNAFAAFLNSPQARQTMRTIFGERDQEFLAGVREYLKITGKAQKSVKGSGATMAAGVAAGAGAAHFGMLTEMASALGGTLALTSLVAHGAESNYFRNQMLRLAHARGNPEATEQIMNGLRPYLVAQAEQWRQKSTNLPTIDIPDITPDMLKTEAQKKAAAMKDQLRKSASGIAEWPSKIIQMFQGAVK